MKPIEVKFERKGLAMESNREDVAMALKTWRLRSGLTQTDVAKRWNMSRWTILRVERAKNVSWEMAYRIFALLSEELRKENQE